MRFALLASAVAVALVSKVECSPLAKTSNHCSDSRTLAAVLKKHHLSFCRSFLHKNGHGFRYKDEDSTVTDHFTSVITAASTMNTTWVSVATQFVNVTETRTTTNQLTTSTPVVANPNYSNTRHGNLKKPYSNCQWKQLYRACRAIRITRTNVVTTVVQDGILTVTPVSLFTTATTLNVQATQQAVVNATQTIIAAAATQSAYISIPFTTAPYYASCSASTGNCAPATGVTPASSFIWVPSGETSAAQFGADVGNVYGRMMLASTAGAVSGSQFCLNAATGLPAGINTFTVVVCTTGQANGNTAADLFVLNPRGNLGFVAASGAQPSWYGTRGDASTASGPRYETGTLQSYDMPVKVVGSVPVLA